MARPTYAQALELSEKQLLAALVAGEGPYGYDGIGSSPSSGGGETVRRTATITRPSNTTGYAVGDVVTATVAAVLDFDDVVSSNGGSGTIYKLKVTTSNKLDGARYALYVFNETQTAIADNAAYKFTAAGAPAFQGVIVTEPGSSGNDATSDASFHVSRGDELPFVCADEDTHLYAFLVILDIQVPTSGQTYDVEILVR